jgi:hypothetical protein
MKIVFIRNTAPFGYAYAEGEPLDCSSAQGNEFIELGYARLVEDSEEGLPKELPGRDALIAAGIKEVKDVPTEVEALNELNGIGKATAEKIVAFLKK